MFRMKNIIRSANRTGKLNILIFQEGAEEYVERLCMTGHNFYCISDYCSVFPWRKNEKPMNLHVYKEFTGAGELYFDLIIAFDRTRMYENAVNLSNIAHIPMIVVDTIGSMTKVPMPFFTSAQINNEQVMYTRNGVMTISTTNIVKESWYSSYTSFSTTIPICGAIQVTSGNKILIDPRLPKEYLESLPFDVFNTNMFTGRTSDVKYYLHLWQHITPLMIDCLCSGIPVVTLKSMEFSELIENKNVIIIENLNEVLPLHQKDLVFNKYNGENNSIDNFVIEWSRVLKHMGETHYMR